MERGRVVVDASVIVKWFVEEEYSREARLMRDAYVNGILDLATVSLLPYEVLNALKYSGAFGEDELKDVTQVLNDFQFSMFNLEGELAVRAVEIGMRKGLTIYDASYVALAQVLNTVLYTVDEKLIKKTKNISRVKHIAEFEIGKIT